MKARGEGALYFYSVMPALQVRYEWFDGMHLHIAWT